MKTERELLIELIGNAPASVDCIVAEADYLLANGVGFRSEWISVKERLPEEDGQYLVVVKGPDEIQGCVLNAWFNTFTLSLVPVEIGWTLLNEFYEFSDRLRCYITHWMPLPEPPGEGAK